MSARPRVPAHVRLPRASVPAHACLPARARVAEPRAPASTNRVAAVTGEAPHPFGLAVPGLGAG
jgi:hypothetical protein